MSPIPHIRKNVPLEEKEIYINFLKKKKYIFIWTYMKMLSLDLEIIYLLAVRADKQPV